MTMRVIAEFGRYKVEQALNGLYTITDGQRKGYTDEGSAYELIRNFVDDKDIRAELLKQWALRLNGRKLQ